VARQARIAAARIADLGPQALAQARRALGARDRRRLAGFRSEKRKREFLASRALLQKMGVRFDSSPAGGIRVRGRGGASVSHARGWVACVVVSSGRAGIDIEPMIERDFAKLGEWQFGRKLSREEFYEHWTRYEARVKAFGDGAARRSHAERTWFLDGRVALSACVPRSSRFSFSPASRSLRPSATRQAVPSSRSTATSRE
jgi:phosphopantetheinyl transferase